ncbi:PKD-like domain-containing protein, partial [Flavobacterium sp. RSSA_27]|uniref:PKD-like domain-containing protein n=2 Tax=Flavobacterium sp. RSSA_27 TaxID=3447667 RepID=UPI003F313CDF
MKTKFTHSTRLFAIILFSVFSFSTVLAQTAPCDNCVSGDIKVLGGELVRSDGTPLASGTCDPGTTVEVYLKINLDVTSNERYGFLMAGSVILNGVTLPFNKCIAKTLNAGLQSFIIDKNNLTIGDPGYGTPYIWTCGSTIQLAGLLTAWENSAPATAGVYEVCSRYNNGVYNCKALTPKCKYYGPSEQIIITTPLAADFTTSSSCQGGNFERITFTSTSNGGKTPYTYSWTVKDNITNATLTTSTLDIFNYTPTGPNPLSVTLQVTDSSTPTRLIKSITKTVTPIACCTTPVGSASPQTICSSGTSNVVLNSTVNGTTYTWTSAILTSPTGGTITGFSNCTTTCGTSISQTLTNTGTSSGVIRYTVTPKSGVCTGTPFTVDVTVNAVLNATVAKTDITCFGSNNGTINISTPTGGGGTYEYRLDSGTWQSSGNFNSLAPGTYNVQIRDKANTACVIVLGNQTITQPAVLSATVASTNVTCNAANDGTITISAPLGGYGTYQYSINGGTTWQDSGTFTALANATYNVQIRDKANTACVKIL